MGSPIETELVCLPVVGLRRGYIRRWLGSPLVAAVLFACGSTELEEPEGGGRDSETRSGEEGERSAAASETAESPSNVGESTSDTPDLDSLEVGEEGSQEDAEASLDGASDEGERGDQANACKAPEGVSASPETIDQLIELLNALPKPTSVACLVESLERPLDVFLTRSPLSAQPAVGAQNPRVFVFSGPLQFTFVTGGPASDTLEFGFRHEEGRAVRGEIGFPIRQAITASTLVDRIGLVTGRSVCGNCHGEERAAGPGFFEGALASDVIAPASLYDVELSVLEEELSVCDDQQTAERCALLQALLLPGQLRSVEFR